MWRVGNSSNVACIDYYGLEPVENQLYIIFFTKFTLCTTRHDLLWNQKYGSSSQYEPMDHAFHATGIDMELCSEISDT